MDATPNPARDAFEAVTAMMGPPRRRPLTNVPTFLRTDSCGEDDKVEGVHPCFALAHHYHGGDVGDHGYTAAPGRGDHLSVPCWTERDHRVYVIEVGFHKGDLLLTTVDWPEARPGANEGLTQLLIAFETR